MITLKTLTRGKHSFRDEVKDVLNLDMEPAMYGTPEAAAKAFHQAMIKSISTDSRYHLYRDAARLFEPDHAARNGYGRCWAVDWESGPYQWAQLMTHQLHAEGWYTEPHTGWVICFEPK